MLLLSHSMGLFHVDTLLDWCRNHLIEIEGEDDVMQEMDVCDNVMYHADYRSFTKYTLSVQMDKTDARSICQKAVLTRERSMCYGNRRWISVRKINDLLAC
jgi:hypothetical protein